MATIRHCKTRTQLREIAEDGQISLIMAAFTSMLASVIALVSAVEEAYFFHRRPRWASSTF